MTKIDFMEVVLGENIKIKQITVLVFSVIFTVAMFLATLYTQNVYYLLIMISALAFFIGINWLYSKIYEVRVNDSSIYCSNLYHKEIFQKTQFDSIVTSKDWIPPFILFPFPSPPYFVFKMKEDKGFMFMDTSSKAFFSMFNLEKHIKNLNTKVNTVLRGLPQ